MKKKLSILIALVMAISLCLVPAVASASPGVISYWHLDEGSGTIAADSVGGNPGTLTNGPVWTTGKVGGALSFDGIDDYVIVPDADNLDITGAITVEAWIYPNTVVEASSDWRAVVYKLHTSGTDKGGYGLMAEVDQSGVYFFTEAGGVAFAGGALTLDAWNHVVGTLDATGYMALYVNGVLVDSGDVGTDYLPWQTDRPLYIGGNPDDDGFAPYEFDGVIDEVAVYDSALTAGEVLGRYYNTAVTMTALTLISAAVDTSAATSVDLYSATLNGDLTAMGTATSVDLFFEWKVEGGTYAEVTATPSSASAATAFTYNLTGLTHNTTYYFRAKAVGDSTVYGAELSFTTTAERIGISVSPTSIDFGSILAGQSSDAKTVTVTNTGNIVEKFTAILTDEDPLDFYTNNLAIDTKAVIDWWATREVDGTATPSLVLSMPDGAEAGPKTATIIFIAGKQ